MKATKILGVAIETMKARGKEYDDTGDGERSMRKTVEVFNLLFGRDLIEEEGWLFMAILKLVRSQQGDAPKADNYIDLAAYAALAGERAMLDLPIDWGMGEKKEKESPVVRIAAGLPDDIDTPVKAALKAMNRPKSWEDE